MNGKLFLSHAHRDKEDVQTLRRALEDNGVAVWEDVLELRAGDRLADLEKEVKGCRGFLLVWTPAASESRWVERETGWALQARKENSDYRILVLLRGAGGVSAQRLLGEELVFIPADGAIEEAVPEIRRALGERAASGRIAEAPVPAPPLEEVVLSFSDARIEESGGRRRAAGRFRVEHDPADGPGSRSAWQDFESPLGPIELEEIRWYLERYPGWPFGPFRDRAKALEAKLREWGRALYDLTLGKAPAQTSAWRRATGHARRVVIEVEDPGPAEGAVGAAALLTLPWELLADEDGFLFEGGLAARVIRRIPREVPKAPLPVADRLRVLLVIARPEEQGVSFLDPRSSARPLIEALAPLGHRAELKVLEDGTYPALSDALSQAEAEGRPFHVVHFDGHGIYDKHLGLGKLCFENPEDARQNKLQRRAELVDADRLGALLRERRVPLFLLEACQTAMAHEEVTASVAARLLRAGVGSVLAMTHAVLVETSRRFVGRFYKELAEGERIGTAMVEAERELAANPVRGEVGGYGELELQDWFVPVLFQEDEGDLQLLQAGPADPQDLAAQRRVREGDLPPAPAHGFVGRARDLLALQRLLREHRVLTVLGEGGQGKTALAIESARWLLDLRLFERVAFASVEDLPDARVLLDRLGRQLVPGYSVAIEEGTGTPEEQLKRARLPVERVLAERRVLLVVDNLESILPAPGQAPAPGLAGVLELLSDFARIGETRLILTSREAPPAPLEGVPLPLGRLAKSEGRELVAGVLARTGRAPAGSADEKWVDELIETVGGHARSLVLLAPLVVERGLQVTAESVGRMMAELEAKHPGKRELSLLASVRLSLDRLPAPARRQVRALAVFHGAMPYFSLAQVLEVEPDEALALCRQLVELGLADAEEPYLFPDPALGPAVADELTVDERSKMEERWFGTTLGLIDFLYQMKSQDAEVAGTGCQAAAKDLIAALFKAEEKTAAGDLSVEVAMVVVIRLQALVRGLGWRTILSQIEAMRQRLERRLGEWSHARFISAGGEIEQRLNSGDVRGAVEAAERLKERAETVGDAYPGAAYDIAMAFNILGQALTASGRSSEALSPLEEAEQRFAALAHEDQSAARMTGVVVFGRGLALLRLGKLDEAAELYERSIVMAEEEGDLRQAAASRGQLGSVRLDQGRLKEALQAHEQARQTFEALHEPASVATAWHLMGRVYEEAEQLDLAEAAYHEALRIQVGIGRKDSQASTLDELGILYWKSNNLEGAAQLHKQAAALRQQLGDFFRQARSLNNLALALQDLGRPDEARQAAIEATHLNAPFGHAAEPWKTWGLLEQIETQAGRPEAARAARARSVALYSEYRRDGGEPRYWTARLITAVGEVIREHGPEEARSLIPPPEKFSEELLPVRDALLSIIEGSRDPVLTQDPRLDYDDAVELSLLLESLAVETIQEAVQTPEQDDRVESEMRRP